MSIYKKPFLKTSEVAQIFSVNPSTVFLWVKKGKLRPKKTLGGNFRFSQDQVLRLWEQQQTDSSFLEDKRKEPRYTVDFPVSISMDEKSDEENAYTGTVKDVSNHGLALVVDKDSDLTQKIKDGSIQELRIINEENVAFRQKITGKITHLKETEEEVKIGLSLEEEGS
jgi:excisionase family DNA binding protein